eukprot:TRINITY_DN1269_c1_g2_i1.p1 TRINITY_DN1269_c1_g2~~TRINITY_DN1269_c1_g2_i1.p1  ORF type:complete len:271 (-),score=47.01 TRINITY_DN1269_c1_g2_i1:391-1203(-)
MALVTDWSSEQTLDSDKEFAFEYCDPVRHVEVAISRDGKKALTLAIPQSIDKICSILWPSGEVLAGVVATELREVCEAGSAILELGCGSALPSMVAAYLGAQVLATDLDLAAARSAVAQNGETMKLGSGSLLLKELRWGGLVPRQAYAAVLVADALYSFEGLSPLASTLADLVADAIEAPRILLAYQRRNLTMEKHFFESILPEKSLRSRELSPDALTQMPEHYRTYIKVVEIFSSDSQGHGETGVPLKRRRRVAGTSDVQLGSSAQLDT